jgi:hypothetical protein
MDFIHDLISLMAMVIYLKNLMDRFDLKKFPCFFVSNKKLIKFRDGLLNFI